MVRRHAFRRGLATDLHRLGAPDKVLQQILRHANVTTTINIYVKRVTQDAEEAMRKLESKCSLVVPQRVPQLPFELGKSGASMENSSGCKTLPLEAVRGNLAERGGIEASVGEWEVSVGERWYVSCFQYAFLISSNRQIPRGI